MSHAGHGAIVKAGARKEKSDLPIYAIYPAIARAPPPPPINCRDRYSMSRADVYLDGRGEEGRPFVVFAVLVFRYRFYEKQV
jgi:hypothetical protein